MGTASTADVLCIAQPKAEADTTLVKVTKKRPGKEVNGVKTKMARAWIASKGGGWLRDSPKGTGKKKRVICVLCSQHPDIAFENSKNGKCMMAEQNGALYYGETALHHHFGPSHAAVVHHIETLKGFRALPCSREDNSSRHIPLYDARSFGVAHSQNIGIARSQNESTRLAASAASA